MSSPAEISQALLNSALTVAAGVGQKGQTYAQAIDAAVHHIRTRQALSLLDEARVRDWLDRELPNAIRAGQTESEPDENLPAADARQLYRRVGPTRFSPVGKPPFIFPPLWLYRLIDGQRARKLSADCIRRRKKIVAATAAAFLLAALFPPWIQTFDLNSSHTQSEAGYAFLFSPPQPRDYSYSVGIKLDTLRLGIELACVFAAGIGAWFMYGGEKNR